MCTVTYYICNNPMCPKYRQYRETCPPDGKCPSCGRKLDAHPEWEQV